MRVNPLLRVSLAFIGIAGICLVFADLEIVTVYPWQELGRMGLGLVTPDFFATEGLVSALLNTISFALLGVAAGNLAGFGLSLVFHMRPVRLLCAIIRSVHELFWALIFLQIFGLTWLTGVLAIAIPYAGIVAKVYSEILDESDPSPLQVIPAGAGHTSILLFARLPNAWAHFKTYSLYRLECGLRSSAILGFIGLPTLGFHLESAFMQGGYSEAAALLIIFYLVIASIRKWVRQTLLPFYLLAALFLLPGGTGVSWANVAHFFTQDIVPHPLRVAEHLDGETLMRLWNWCSTLFIDQALPGAISTLQLSVIALVGTGVLTLLFFPLVSPKFFGPFGRGGGHLFLVILRSTPEYILAYMLLQLWGPSMLPAIVALALHNGGIIGHLIGRYTETMPLRPDAPGGMNLYFYEMLPRVYPQFLAFLFYRWEVILRETAILGMLGIHTLGFYIDSAFADIRFDRALLLIAVTAALNIGVDALSRGIRAHLRLKTTPDAG